MVEVCFDCDIAGCKCIRQRKEQVYAKPSNEYPADPKIKGVGYPAPKIAKHGSKSRKQCPKHAHFLTYSCVGCSAETNELERLAEIAYYAAYPPLKTPIAPWLEIDDWHKDVYRNIAKAISAASKK